MVEWEVRDREGHWFALRMRPYRTGEKKIEGVLVALLDIDTVRRSLDVATEARDFAESIVETVREPLLVLDAKFRVERATRQFLRNFRRLPGGHRRAVLFRVGRRTVGYSAAAHPAG